MFETLRKFLGRNSQAPKFTSKKHQVLDTNYIGSVPSVVNYRDIKAALQAEDLGALIRIFEHFKRFDTQISSEFNRRKLQVTRLPIMIECADEAQSEFLEKFTRSVNFRLFLTDMANAIPYGFSAFFINYEVQNGLLVPKYELINPRYFESDEKMRPYISQGAVKIYLDDTALFTHFHPTDSGNIIEKSLIYKVVCIAALKHIAISSYMNYLDSLAVPPLIVKSDATQDKELSELVLKCALDLRSNGVGLFGKDDDVAVLNGGVDKETFLSFMRYCDECISKVITGQVLAGNSTQNGTQALGTVHSAIQKEACEFDAALLSASAQIVLKKALELNFESPADFVFELDTNTEKDEKLQADTYAVLANMGVRIPIEHLEKTFKINGLEYIQTPNYSGFSSVGGANLGQNSQKLSLNSTQKGNELAQRLLNKAATLPANDFERYFNEFSEKNADFDFEKFAEIFENSASFEDAEKALLAAFEGENYPIAEQLLFELGANAELLGVFLQGDKK